MSGNGKIDFKEGINLLDDGSSDSDSHEHFALPPLNLKSGGGSPKVLKRARPPSRCMCSPMLVVVVFGLSVMAVVIGILATYTYHLKTDVDLLKSQLNKTMKAGSGTNNEMTDFHSRQESLEAKMKELGDGDKGIEGINLHISEIFNQIHLLNISADYLTQKVKGLEERVAKAPIIAALPKKVDVLEQGVASMGSDLTTMKADVGALQQARTDILSRLNTLDQPESDEKDQGGRSAETHEDSSQTPGEVISIKDFIASVADWNQTITGQLKRLSSRSHQQSIRIEEVDNKTLALDNRVSLLELRSVGSVTGQPMRTAAVPDMEEIVQEAVNSVLEELKNFTKDERESVDAAATKNITERINRMSETMQALQQQLQEALPAEGASSTPDVSSVNFTQKLTELQTLVEEYRMTGQANYQTSNSSLFAIETRVSSLEVGVITLGGRVDDLETIPKDDEGPIVVEKVVEVPSVDLKTTLPPVVPSQTPPDEQEPEHVPAFIIEVSSPPVTTTTTTTTTTLIPVSTETTNADEAATWGSDESDETRSTEAEEKTQDMNTRPLISVDFIKSPADLKNAFLGWDPTSSGYVLYKELVDALGTDMPSEQDMSQFDLNTDNRYTLDELAPAFGFTVDSVINGNGGVNNGESQFLPQEATSTENQRRKKRRVKAFTLNDLLNQV